MRAAYDAQRHYGVHYQELEEYDLKPLMEADKLPVLDGRDKYLHWLQCLEHAVAAACKRAQLRVLPGGKPPRNS